MRFLLVSGIIFVIGTKERNCEIVTCLVISDENYVLYIVIIMWWWYDEYKWQKTTEVSPSVAKSVCPCWLLSLIWVTLEDGIMKGDTRSD